MILESCDRITAKLGAYEQARQTAGRVDALEQRRGQLAEKADPVAAAAAVARLLAARGVLPADRWPREEAGAVAALCRAVRDRLAENPDGVAKGDGEFRKLLAACGTLATALGEASRGAWEAHAAARRARPDGARLKQAGQVGRGDLVGQIRAAERDADRRAASPPTTPAGFDEAEAAWKKLTNLIDRLPEPTDDPEVNRFLQRTSAGGAPLDLLTPAVADWLRDQDLTGDFRIVPR